MRIQLLDFIYSSVFVLFLIMNAHNIVFLSTLKFLKSVASNENDILGQINFDGQIYTMAVGNKENLTFQSNDALWHLFESPHRIDIV